MAKKIIMPALGMAQETGLLMAWLIEEGEAATAGEPLMEIETDKTTVEVEAPASGVLAGVTAQPGDEVPVGQTIAWILAPGESLPAEAAKSSPGPQTATTSRTEAAAPPGDAATGISPVAARMAVAHGIDLSQVVSKGSRITKSDVEAYIKSLPDGGPDGRLEKREAKLSPASPKARRLAREGGLNIAAITGSGPEGAVLAADVLKAETIPAAVTPEAPLPVPPMSQAWRVMAQRMTESWTSTPHIYLVREVEATRFVAWREATQKRTTDKITYTDLLVKVVASALEDHPLLNAAWIDGEIQFNPNINIGLAVATDDGLIVPVIHQANTKPLVKLAAERAGVVGRALNNKLKLNDLQDGTFTISNLGMYGVDAFNAIVNPPQAAILAVGRIVERVIPVEGLPAVRPVMMFTLSLDHRMVDGARGAQFLDKVAGYIEEPLGMI